MATAWADAVHPYGDLFQRTLTNPFVLAVSLAAKTGEFPPRFPGSRWSPDEAFADALVQTHKSFSAAGSTKAFLMGTDPLLENTIAGSALDGLRICDLGAGEGYVGRLVSQSGASYTGIDISTTFARIAEQRRSRLGIPRDRFRWLTADLDLPAQQDGTALNSLIAGLMLAPKPDIVLCLSLLDHLKNPQRLLRALRCWLCSEKNDNGPESGCLTRPVAVVTLNPEFFLGPCDWPSNGPSSMTEVFMAPSSRKVSIWPRFWTDYEIMFSNCGYHVLWCHPTHLSQAPTPLADAYIEAAGCAKGDVASPLASGTLIPTMGPFVFWILMAKPMGIKVPEATSALPPECILSKEGLADDEIESIKRIEGARRVRLDPGEPLALAGNLSDGFVIILEGCAQLVRDYTVSQTFRVGAFLGELESGDNFYVRRFPYSVFAGVEQGAAFLQIPRAGLSGIIARAPETIAGRIFALLRDRVAATTWVYHQRPGKTKVTKCAGMEFGTHPEITPPRLRQCARALMLSATLEAESRPRLNALTVCLSVKEISELVGAEGAKPFGHELRLLSMLGIIEGGVFGAVESAERPFIIKLTKLALETIGNLNRDVVEAIREEKDAALFEFVRGSVTMEAVCRGGSTGKIHLVDGFLEKDRGKLVAFEGWLSSRLKNASRENIHRIIGNVLWLRNRLFRDKREVVFLRINNMHSLRMIAFSSDDDIAKYVISRRNIVGSLAQIADQYPILGPRRTNYHRIIEAYLRACWVNGYDIGLATDGYQGVENGVKQFIKQYQHARAGHVM